MTSSNPFDPAQFFINTAHYASKGRGLFKLPVVPTILIGEKFGNNNVARGLQILQSGLMATAFEIPSQMLATHDDFSFNGPTRKVPYGSVFNDISVTFLIADGKKETAACVYHTFNRWQENAVGPIVKTDKVASDDTAFGARYYSDIVTDAFIQSYSPTSQTPVLSMKLTEIYPLSIGGLNVSWDATDGPLSVSVTFAYHYAYLER